MPITYTTLPQQRSVYDYPVTMPGQELTEEQEDQAAMATIAGIVLALATSKAALSDAVTGQLTLLLRATDLTSQTAVKAFAASAAQIVEEAISQSRELTWSAIRARGDAIGLELFNEFPSTEDLPNEYRYTRSSTLERAYERIANEYTKWIDKGESSPTIQDVIRQFEEAQEVPIPRAENLTTDYREGETNGEPSWREAFRQQAWEQREATREADTERAILEEEREAERAAAREAREARAAQLEAERVQRESESATRRSEIPEKGSDIPRADSESGAGTEADESIDTITLTPREKEVVIERYAEQKAEELAERMVQMDIALASRNAQAYAMERIPSDQVKGYRRVIHPELNKSGTSCGLCIVASTMRYTKGDLLPIHAGCKCETCEIFVRGGEEFDPGGQINMEDLEVFYESAGGSTHGWDLKKSRFKVENHPEYGSILVHDKANEDTEPVSFEDRMGTSIT